MNFFAQIVGLFAVVTLLLSYQQRRRKNIILLNIVSRVLYITQYILLRAIEGAVFDVLGTISCFAAQSKDKGFLYRYAKIIFITISIFIVIVGIFLYKNIFSLFPVIGVLLQTAALWMNDEKSIRIVSFLSVPFWLIYDLVNGAYAAVLGHILTMVSIITSIYRYDIQQK